MGYFLIYLLAHQTRKKRVQEQTDREIIRRRREGRGGEALSQI